MFALSILGKATLLIATVAIIQTLLRRRLSAAMRHQLWTLTVMALLLLPALTLALPAWTALRLPARVASTVAAAPASADLSEIQTGVRSVSGYRSASGSEPFETAPPAPRIHWLTALTIAYAAGVLLLCARLIVQRAGLARMARAASTDTSAQWAGLLPECADQLGVRRPVLLLRSRERTMPMAFGAVHASVLIPSIGDSWPEDRRRAVLLHELAHIARHDCLTQTLAAIACALYWVHPGAWWIARRLRIERELACDDRVLTAGASPRDYAGHLLELAYALRANLAPALSVTMASPRQLEGRMLALLDEARNRALPSARARLAGTLLMAAVIVPVATATTMTIAADEAQNARPAAPAAGGSTTPVATGPGTWEIRPVREAGYVHLRMSEGHGYYGHNVEVTALSGLAPSLLSGAGGSTGFSIRRDAGTFTFEGAFRNGVGAGTFTFAPDDMFAAAMARRGYEQPTPDQLRALARGNVGLTYIDMLVAQGYRSATLAQILRASDHGVELEYLGEMGRLGYRTASLDALVELRDHGVTPPYITGLAAEGLPRLSAAELVRARDHGVTPEYVHEMAQLGLRLQALDALIRARDHGVSTEYVRDMRALGYTLPVDELITARDHGVSVDYVRDLAKLGYPKLPLEELVRLRDHGVNPGYIDQLADLGYAGLSIDDLVGLRNYGVSPEQVRRANGRLGSRLSVDRLRELAANGWR